MAKRQKRSKLVTQTYRVKEHQVKGLDTLAEKEDRYASELVREAIDILLRRKGQNEKAAGAKTR